MLIRGESLSKQVNVFVNGVLLMRAENNEGFGHAGSLKRSIWFVLFFYLG